MSKSEQWTRWTWIGGVAGLTLFASYLMVLFTPIPWPLRRLIFISLGLAGVVYVLALAGVLRREEESVSLRIATVFGVVGMALLNLMAVVQAAIGARMDTDPPRGGEIVAWVRDSVNAVHLGMDTSFDLFMLTSLGLFAAVMWRHPVFGPWFALPGGIAAGATLALNLYTFPLPPDPDLGPWWPCG